MVVEMVVQFGPVKLMYQVFDDAMQCDVRVRVIAGCHLIVVCCFELNVCVCYTIEISKTFLALY